MSETNQKTLGQIRTGAKMNPDEKVLVERIKNASAELIDLCGQLRKEDSSGERHRAVSLAQTEIEAGCMWAVRANYTE